MSVSDEGRPRLDRIPFDRIADAVLNNAETLVKRWLPDGHKAGPEWKSINPVRNDKTEGSFSVNFVKGKWGDFAAGVAGNDLISLYAYLFHDDDQIAAARELAAELGIEIPPANGKPVKAKPVPAVRLAADAEPQKEKKRVSAWVPVLPAPDGAPEAPKAHPRRGAPEMAWCYRSSTGRVLGYIYRFRTSDGGKEVLPVCWCRNDDSGAEEWHWMAFPEPRPLYGLDALASKPEATVLVVEGEKCAAMAAVELPDLVVMTWPGGTNAEFKADWAPLAGRKVVFWPDCDAKRAKLSKEEADAGVDPLSKPYLPEGAQPGAKAARKICTRLHELGCKVWLVRIPAPGEKPDGWDIADAIADGLKGEDLANWIRGNLSVFDPAALATESSESISTAKNAGAGQREEVWHERLLWKKGELSDCLANIYDILTNTEMWHGVVAFDEFAQRTVKLKPPPYFGGAVGEWDSTDDSQSAMWLTRRWSMTPSSARVAEAIETLAHANAFHPVRDWLRALPAWDGTERLSMWLTDYLNVKCSPYTQRVGTWYLMGMVARAMKPGCKFDYCLVLEGEQGKKKSTALNVLGGDWFGDTDLDLHNKDSMIALQGKWLYEIAELGALARSESMRQKSFLSRRVDEFRPPYGRRDVKCPRQLVFAGTTNEWDWNKDPTGGRRFWPVECGDIDPVALAAVREQLFAEALAYYDAGNRYWPAAEEQKALFDPEQLRREQPESLVDALHDWVYAQVADFSIAQAVLDGLDLDASKLTRDLQTRVGVALRKLGCAKVEKRNGMTRYWYKPPVRNGATATGDHAEQPASGGKRVPF